MKGRAFVLKTPLFPFVREEGQQENKAAFS